MSTFEDRLVIDLLILHGCHLEGAVPATVTAHHGPRTTLSGAAIAVAVAIVAGSIVASTLDAEPYRPLQVHPGTDGLARSEPSQDPVQACLTTGQRPYR